MNGICPYFLFPDTAKEAREIAKLAERESDFSSSEQTSIQVSNPNTAQPPPQPTSLLKKNFPYVSNPPTKGNKTHPSSSSASELTPTSTRTNLVRIFFKLKKQKCIQH